MNPNRLAIAALLVLMAGGACTTDRDDPRYTNPLDPSQGLDLPAPDGLTASMGADVVVLTWRESSSDEVDEYVVFRARPSESEDEVLLARVLDPEYRDESVQVDRTYRYRVAAGSMGWFGRRSESIQVTPRALSIVLADEARATSDRRVTVLASGAGAEAIRLSEDPADVTAPWRPLDGSLSWTLSPSDGTKTVFAWFRFPQGVVSDAVMDEIELDTRARIESVSFDGPTVIAPGDLLHVRAVAGETGGACTVTLTGVFDDVALYDDGAGGDAVADDGVYERSISIPSGATATAEPLTASFTDEVGNTADPVTAVEPITVASRPTSPELVELRPSDPSDPPGLTLRWTVDDVEGDATFRVFRSEAAEVDSTDRLLEVLSDPDAETFDDDDVVEGRTYAYRVYLRNEAGLQAGSNVLSATVPNDRAPGAPVIESVVATSATRVSLGWSPSTERDFAEYRLHRNDEGAVSQSDSLITAISDVTRTYFDDAQLRENTTYFYRLFVVDEGGLVGRSDEVEVTTANRPPPMVTLEDATDVDASGATLTWAASDAHDFASYQLYRDVIPTVTPGSTLVVELDSPSFTSFRDSELDGATQYYYRVFVVDDADDPEQVGSNTIGVLTP